MTSSIEHIRATPGFADRDWPKVMGLAENLDDLRKHAEDFRLRKGFSYAVLDPADGDVIGCVYVYPPRVFTPAVRSWVRAGHAHLDVALWRPVSLARCRVAVHHGALPLTHSVLDVSLRHPLAS